jgi:hypothetical protein
MRAWHSGISAVGLAAVLALAVFAPCAAEAAKKPNILFVILDDVGIDQMEAFGFGGKNPPILPNINTIAAQGVKFTNVWAMPQCSPSRAAFFTGRYPERTGVLTAIVDNHIPQTYLSSFEATLPRVLSEAGYVSALIGKYHMGSDSDPAGDCAPATRGFNYFRGNMTAGPPSIDVTAGGAFGPDDPQVCGYLQGAGGGACYVETGSAIGCAYVSKATADDDTTPARTCLQRGGIFTPGKACGIAPPTAADFDVYNAYYVWPRTTETGPQSPLALDSCKAPFVDRNYMTSAQTNAGISWWNDQIGPRMLAVAYNAIHAPLQKAPTTLVPDPNDRSFSCPSFAPARPLVNSMFEGMDFEIGRLLEKLGLAELDRNGTITSLDLDDTVIVMVGDNGSFGSTVRLTDGFSANRSKGTVYETGVWVPLIVAGSVVARPGREVDEMVNIVDLFELFGELAGVRVREIVPPALRIDSRPMLSYLADPTPAPVRDSNFTQLGVGVFTPDPDDRSWPCTIAAQCSDVLFPTKSFCGDNQGVWYGPGADAGVPELTSCCAVQDYLAGTTNVNILPVTQYAARDDVYKLVQLGQIDCASPLQPGDTPAFPWAEYNTKPVVEFYDLTPIPGVNPAGIDVAGLNLLQNCPEGSPDCLPSNLRSTYRQLTDEIAAIQQSQRPGATCQAKGDGNLDLRVNAADIAGYRSFKNQGPSRYDINVDAKTNDADLTIIQANQGLDCLDPCSRADLDRNGRVEGRDRALLTAQTGPCKDNLCGGDLDGDGTVGAADVSLLASVEGKCPADGTTDAAALTLP